MQTSRSRFAALGMVGIGAAVLSAAAINATARPAAQARSAAPTDSADAAAVLAAVRGATPIACSLVAHALENRWGSGRHVTGPDAATLDDAQADAVSWAWSSSDVDLLVPLFRRAMTDPDACVRRVAAALSARVHATDLAIALRSELASSSTDVRETAVLALGYAGKGNAEPALAAAARDADVRVRRLAAWGLGRSGNAAALAPLDRLIGDDDPLVRVNAALAMGSLSRRDAVPVLVGVLRSDRDPHVRRAAAAALGRIE